MSHTRAPQQRFLWGETRFLMDYLKATYPGRQWFTNIRVGPITPHIPRDGLSDAQIKLMGAFRRYADAVVPLERELVVVEATIIKAVQKIGPLMEYLDLVPQTPELAHLQHLKLRGELVSPIPDPRVQKLASRVGLRFVVFNVDWLDQVQQIYGRRFRRAPLSDVSRTFVS